MSIEQKIAELLAESKKLQQEEIVEEAIDEKVKPFTFADHEENEKHGAAMDKDISYVKKVPTDHLHALHHAYVSNGTRHDQVKAIRKELQSRGVKTISHRAGQKAFESVYEEVVTPVKGEEEANVKKNNTDQTVEGPEETGISATTDDDNDQSQERTPKGGSTKHADTTSGKSISDAAPVDQSKEIKVNVSEDVDALMNGEELSEDFRAKATTIFEAAVVTRVKEEISKLEEQFDLQLQEQVEEIKEGLIEKVDGYLNYVVEQWMEQNELALESGIKSEIVENFITGMKGLFEQHYIDIPEEKYDVLGDMEETISSLEEKLNEQVETAVALTQELNAIKREQVIAEAANGLADTDVEKFQALAEELTFEDVDSFSTKLQTIRENYFGKKATSGVQSVVTDEPVQITEEKVYSPMISAVLKQLNSVK